MVRKTKEETEKTYKALLDAASDLFRHQGIAVTTLNEIAKRAGVTRGAFYWHFSDKNDIIRAICRTYVLPKIEPLIEHMRNSSDEDPIEEFRKKSAELIHIFVSDEKMAQAIFIVLHSTEFTEKDSDLQSFFQVEHDKIQNAIYEVFARLQKADLMRPNIDARQVAFGYLCLIMGLLNKFLVPFAKMDLEKEGVEILDFYMSGVMKEWTPNT